MRLGTGGESGGFVGDMSEPSWHAQDKRHTKALRVFGGRVFRYRFSPIILWPLSDRWFFLSLLFFLVVGGQLCNWSGTAHFWGGEQGGTLIG